MTLPRCVISSKPEVLRSHLEGSLAVVVLNLLIRPSEQQHSRAAILERDKQRDYKRRDNLSLVKRVHCMSMKKCPRKFWNGMCVFMCARVAFTTTEMTKLMFHWDQLAQQLICRSAIREKNREKERESYSNGSVSLWASETESLEGQHSIWLSFLALSLSL